MLYTKRYMVLFFCCLTGIILFFPSFSQRSNPKGILYGGMVLGAGWLKLSSNENPGERMARFGMSIYGGVRPLPWLRTGISLGGWTIEPYDYYEYWTGISISNVFGQVQVFPFKKNDLYLNFEGGWSKYINQHPDAFNTKGSGGKLGLGYEQKIGRKKMAINLSMNYLMGRFNDITYASFESTNLHYNVYEVLLGLTFR